ncbi:MAG: LysR family transcriptional regulator [Prosthecobacter sp.]|jgi:LysR family transcriptional regulator for metE and metH|uniref:LysR family transcriptional regulator n=1 Tax=Prosthecobacter sp. TaxID=1965333 RepID=UPI0019F4779B|nr:LysR family transcriptional regulator [Prosthecobacter sp.]MBE2282527.1 LysR family transcriptional regulator [Prosthecobacter sp.]
MLEIRHLNALIALAETGNLSKAGRRLHLSQPALSHQVKSIEQHLGVALFERKSNPLRLSPAGERLLVTAHEVVKLLRQSERDVARIAEGKAGQLRIAVECHSCFDWLMPAMDAFREGWPEVEMDIVSGFHPDPVSLLAEDKADLVIVSKAQSRKDVVFDPLFRYELLALLARKHPLTRKAYLTAADFAAETLITYPIPDDRIDIIREVLSPAGVFPARRTTMLTVAILQLVASRRGISAMPAWAVQPYLDKGYVEGRRVRKQGVTARLYVATTAALSTTAYMREFIALMKKVSFATLSGISEA